MQAVEIDPGTADLIASILGVLQFIAGMIGLFVVAAVGKWFQQFRMRMNEMYDVVMREGGLRDDVMDEKAARKVLIAALEKENIISVEVDKSTTHHQINQAGSIGTQAQTGNVKHGE